VATPPAALHTEGVPPLPAELLQQVQRYDPVAGHAFVDWHPVLREMLVAHRPPGASTTQIYRLREPGALLEPLTQGNEPVSRAQWEPRWGQYLVYAQGTAAARTTSSTAWTSETRQSTCSPHPTSATRTWAGCAARVSPWFFRAAGPLGAGRAGQ
jgi:hypothetical protein